MSREESEGMQEGEIMLIRLSHISLIGDGQSCWFLGGLINDGRSVAFPLWLAPAKICLVLLAECFLGSRFVRLHTAKSDPAIGGQI